MDVDLLRPGTVPIAPETVLWFEFLLDQNLLLNHLKKSAPDPSPIDLIRRFYEAIVETLRNRVELENNEQIIEPSDHKIKHPAKSIALKILSLKVAAFLHWNLQQIRILPFKIQIHLMQDLLYFTNERKPIEIPKIQLESIENLQSPHIFALTIYYRWLLNVTMHRVTSSTNYRYSQNDITPIDESVYCTPENIQSAIDFLTHALKLDTPPNLLTIDCFNLPTETQTHEFDWTRSQPIKLEEFASQLHYDLGEFFFWKENYRDAQKCFEDCWNEYQLIDQKINKFATFHEKSLEMYRKACQIDSNGGLLEQLNDSIQNGYVGITNILLKDNIQGDIPLVHRLNLELNIQGALSSGIFTAARDLLPKIKALNIIRCVIGQKPTNQIPITPKFTTTLLWAVQSNWLDFNLIQRNLLKKFLMKIILKNLLPDLFEQLKNHELIYDIFDKYEWQYLENTINFTTKSPIDPILIGNDWIIYDFTKKRKPKMELKQFEQQLITSYDHKLIRDLLMKIGINHLELNVWQLNMNQIIPIQLQTVLKSLPIGFLQDFSFILLTKSIEQIEKKNWHLALEYLVIIDKELDNSNTNNNKLSSLISWEVLSIQITQLFDEWTKNTIDQTALANACEVCLKSNDTTSTTVLPRFEIIEQCVLCLLNLGRWEFLMNLDKRWQSFDMINGIVLACHELLKFKATKKLTKNLWDLVLPIFSGSTTQTTKRTNNNSTTNTNYQDQQLTNLKTNLSEIFSKLRDATVLAIVISLLTRLYNVLKDETSLELQVEYVNLWPAVISNANSYNPKAACEMLATLVQQGLHYYPNNISWLRLSGDINFANGHYKESLNYYLQSLLICSDYFNVVRNDDHVYRRMIKCCTALGCHMQAAVLCQFLEEIDYVLAFRILGDMKSCNDALDAYYHCIWDTNLLEYLIHTHHKKGEFQRRKNAQQMIGLLELNSNNNDEIQREASNLRKTTFLRALCKQYVF